MTSLKYVLKQESLLNPIISFCLHKRRLRCLRDEWRHYLTDRIVEGRFEFSIRMELVSRTYFTKI